MERLTHYYKGEVAEPRNRSEARAMAQKLADYEDAEEAGMLIRLPCKVGDDLYFIHEGSNLIEHLKVQTFFIGHPSFRGNMPYLEMIRTDKYDIPIKNLGKTVFLAREEAEAALKARDGE